MLCITLVNGFTHTRLRSQYRVVSSVNMTERVVCFTAAAALSAGRAMLHHHHNVASARQSGSHTIGCKNARREGISIPLDRVTARSPPSSPRHRTRRCGHACRRIGGLADMQ